MIREGLDRIRDLVNTEITEMQTGEGTTGELDTDTGLETPLVGNFTPTATTTTQQLVELGFIPTTSLGGETISEVVFRKASTTTEINRATFAGVSKTAILDEVDIETRWFINTPSY